MTKEKSFGLLVIFFLLIFPQGVFRLMDAEIFVPLSDVSYFTIYYGLMILGGILGILLLLYYGYKDFFKWRFRYSYVGGLVLLFLLNVCWAKLILPYIHASFGNDSLLRRATLYSMFYYRYLISDLLVAPFFEEVYRTIVFAVMTKWRRYYLDVILSAILFSVNHFLYYGWSYSDFITYLIPGLLIGLYFRRTNSIYYLMIYHVIWNAVPYLMGWR
ncbi:CPBP family intramembrane glutamic endopeptidase [Streptococcus fryi]